MPQEPQHGTEDLAISGGTADQAMLEGPGSWVLMSAAFLS